MRRFWKWLTYRRAPDAFAYIRQNGDRYLIRVTTSDRKVFVVEATDLLQVAVELSFLFEDPRGFRATDPIDDLALGAAYGLISNL
jgi:hypothetical protein